MGIGLHARAYPEHNKHAGARCQHAGLTPAARVETAVNGVKWMITSMIEVLSLVMRVAFFS